jgi:hypothetical protein
MPVITDGRSLQATGYWIEAAGDERHITLLCRRRMSMRCKPALPRRRVVKMMTMLQWQYADH